MKNEMSCPVCKAPITESTHACPRCGFKLLGKTEKFQPVVPLEATPGLSEAGTKPILRIETGSYAGESFELGQGKFSIGRDPECDLFLNDMTVSRNHSTINVNGKNASITDDGSTNGTWVDGVVIDNVPLHIGSHIQIGTFEMIFDFV